MLLHNGAIKWEKKKKNVKWAETIPRVVFYQSPTSFDRPSPIQRLRSIRRCINRPANPRASLSPIPFPSLPRIPPQIPPPLRIRRRRRLPPPLLPLLSKSKRRAAPRVRSCPPRSQIDKGAHVPGSRCVVKLDPLLFEDCVHTGENIYWHIGNFGHMLAHWISPSWRRPS